LPATDAAVAKPVLSNLDIQKMRTCGGEGMSLSGLNGWTVCHFHGARELIIDPHFASRKSLL
jgi:hypothetical protein